MEKEKSEYIKKIEELEDQIKNLEKNNHINQNKIKELKEEIERSQNKIKKINEDLNQTKKELEEWNKSLVLLIKTYDENICCTIICKRNEKISEIKKKLFELNPQLQKENSKIKYREQICDYSKSLEDYNIHGNEELYIIQENI